mmetsp:Transcript_11221/g.35631  ORF Transcript_11221/g.35631 Transcript_11221/m.35631 type:complete len:406 (-) Transcript_11221:23-1240(-)
MENTSDDARVESALRDGIQRVHNVMQQPSSVPPTTPTTATPSAPPSSSKPTSVVSNPTTTLPNVGDQGTVPPSTSLTKSLSAQLKSPSIARLGKRKRTTTARFKVATSSPLSSPTRQTTATTAASSSVTSASSSVATATGTRLRDMAFVMDRLTKVPSDEVYLIKLHRALFGTPGVKRARKGNFRDFAGLGGAGRTREQALASLLRMSKTELVAATRLLDAPVDRSAPKEQVAEATADWLVRPVDSGRKVPKKKKAKTKTKKATAAKATKTATKRKASSSTSGSKAKKAKRTAEHDNLLSSSSSSSASASASSSAPSSDDGSDSDNFILAPPKPAAADPAVVNEESVMQLLADQAATIRDMCTTGQVSLRDLYGWIGKQIKVDEKAVRVHKAAIKAKVQEILAAD